MRLENIEFLKKNQKYKNLYNAECQRNKNLMKTMKSMKIDMLYLEQSIKQLKERNSFLKYGPKKRKPRKHKEWDKINSERTKRRRLGHVKELLQTLKSVEVCHRAEISIWLEKNKIHFSFSPSDLNKTRNSDMVNNGFLQHMNSEHSYSKSQADMEIDHLMMLNTQKFTKAVVNGKNVTLDI